MADDENLELIDKKDQLADEETDESDFKSTGEIWRNLLVISFGSLVLFTGFRSLQSLQSSLFHEEGMGTTALAVIYSCKMVSAFFLPSPLVDALGSKYTLSLGMACYIMFIAAHFYPSWGLFIPAAAILGLGAGPLWIAKSHYINNMAHDFAKKTRITKDAATNQFFGIYFLIFQTTTIWGNLISSQVLKPDTNSSGHVLSVQELSSCGANFCPTDDKANNTNLGLPPMRQLYTLAGVYTGLGCLGVLSVLFLLQPLPSEKKTSCGNIKFNVDKLASTFLHLRDYRQVLLIPMSMNNGMEQAFFASDYTQAFITCPLGNWWVGYILICYGLVDACSSFFFGKMVAVVGRFPVFILGAIINFSVVAVLLHFEINQDRVYFYFILAALWGMADGIWQTQVNALYGVLFKETSEAAYSNYKMWEALGFISAFGYQSRLCFPIKAYILVGVLGLGMVGYGIVEFTEWRKEKADKAKE